MKVTFAPAKDSLVKMTLTLEGEEWREQIVEAYNKNKGKYSMQGFRKGKVPMKVLEGVYGEGIFYDDAINLAYRKYYFDALEKHPEIIVVGQPEIDIKEIDDKKLVMIAEIPVKPEVELGSYKGMKIEKVEYNVKDEDINAEIEHKRNDASRLVDVTDRAAQMDDIANIDYSGSVDGVKFDGGTSTGYDLTLGSKSFIPGFEEGVVGMKTGDEKVIDVKFPEDYHEKKLAGKTAQFAVKLNSLKFKELPAVDDEFVKDVSDFNTVDEWKADIKAKLQESNNTKARNEMENKLVDAICDAAKLTIPKAMIEQQIDNMMHDFEYRLMYQGLNLDTYLKYVGIDRETMRKDYESEAEKQVKAELCIDKIIETEGIKSSEEEVEAKIAEMAKSASKEVEDYKKTMKPEQLDYISRNIVIEKLFDFLRKENNID